MKRTNLIATLMMIPGLATAQQIDGMERPAAVTSRQMAAKAKSRARSYRDLVARPAASLSLGELNNVEKAKVGESRNVVGLNRTVSREMAAGGSWDIGPDGTRVWRLKVASTGAHALRVHFTGFDARDGQVVLYGAGNEIVGPYTGKGDDQDGEVWTGLVSGDSMTIEYQTKDESAGIPFENAKIAHFLGSAANTAVHKPFEPIPQAETQTLHSILGAETLGCHVDGACVAEQWQERLRAIAVYFVEGPNGAYGTCTGTVMNNAKQNLRPYFLSANHCFSSAAQARSLIVVWNYQSSYCNGPEVDWTQLPYTTGARLLANGKLAQGDYALLLLNEAPPQGTFFSGWSANADTLAVGAEAVGLHQPASSYKRVSVGQRHPDRASTMQMSTGVEVMPEGKFHLILWQKGLTQGGSSGSGLFAANGVLVGTLTGGSASCESVNNSWYGKLSGYFQYLSRYLVDDNI